MAVQFVMAAPCRLELLLGSWRNVTLAIPFTQFQLCDARTLCLRHY